ncbi:MAG: hypothetical protein AAGB51_08735 [Planctomycetota bacterium]
MSSAGPLTAYETLRAAAMPAERASRERTRVRDHGVSSEFRDLDDGAMADAIARARVACAHDGALPIDLVAEIARRELGLEAVEVQRRAVDAMLLGRIAEMATGEGKTLVGAIAAVLVAWRFGRVHVVTANDYLAERDRAWTEPLLRRCGLVSSAIVGATPPGERALRHSAAVIYTTPKQAAADRLRDLIALRGARSAWAARRYGAKPVVPGLTAAIIDEADAVLIDEAAVPLIIADGRGVDPDSDVYRDAADIAAALDAEDDFEIERSPRRAVLTEEGFERLQAACEHLRGVREHPVWHAPRRAAELVCTALVAQHLYARGREYGLVDGRVVIVDEHTGRFLHDRVWPMGLHQAVEAAEEVTITADRTTLASLSFQRFFKGYRFLCGMTGTAGEAAGELRRVYGVGVDRIPRDRPLIRERRATRIYRHEADKLEAAVLSVVRERKQGRPVLVGTRSIEASERFSARLGARGIDCRVLNAHFDTEEAELIGGAGRSGVVTVATNMAGRGTDIKLDDAAREAGGLHVVLTEPHASARLDRQLEGRSGRRGDPGSTEKFACLTDELFRLHAPGLTGLIRRLTTGRGAVAGTRADALVNMAQKRAEKERRAERARVEKADARMDERLPSL